MYTATKDLVIDGKAYPKGAAVDEKVIGADRAARGVALGHLAAAGAKAPKGKGADEGKADSLN